MKKILLMLMLGFIIFFKSNGMNVVERLVVKDISMDQWGVSYSIKGELSAYSTIEFNGGDGFIPYSNIIKIVRTD